MSTKRFWLTHRGDITALATDGRWLWFVTKHPERQATPLYQLDPLTGELSEQALPGAVDLAYDGTRLIAAGLDGHVYVGPFGAMVPLGAALDPEPVAVAGVSEGGVAVVAGAELLFLARHGAVEGRFGLSGAGSALAADPTGTWVVAGTRDGAVAVFQRGSVGWEALESDTLHQGEVTALRFERDELRFRSAGADNRFLVTHARGALEPIDRGGRNGHSKPVRAIVGDGPLVYTTGDDGHIKAWRRGEKRKPSSQQQGVGPAVAAVQLDVDGAPTLAVAAADASIRLFPLGEDHKVQSRSALFAGAMATALHELEHDEPERRRAALGALEQHADAASVELLAHAAVGDGDPALRLLAAQMLGRAETARAVPPLEDLLRADGEAVRRAALEGLQRHLGARELRPLELALAAGHPDIGQAAVRALTELATADDEAHSTLVQALDHKAKAVRVSALAGLEAVHPTDATASRLGLRSSVADLRWRSLLRLLQRRQLHETDRDLRAATEDEDADVRQVAYLLRLVRHPGLCAALRARDPDLHRNLHAIETHGVEPSPEPPPPPAAGTPETLAPLVQATSARQRDTCLRGASHLARLGDRRAFGVLLQLSREGDAAIQVRACRALQLLDDPRALGRMRSMLRIGNAEVRDAAFSVVDRLLVEEPRRGAEIGLSAPHPDVRARGLRLLVGVLEAGDRGPEARQLVRRALDDADGSVRTGAFKAVLRLGIGLAGDPSPAGALRFALQSVQPPVRREVLTEIMSQIREDWAWRLLLERVDDPEPALRAEAYAFALKHTRGRDPDATVAALGSRFADLRRRAVQELTARTDDRARDLLVRALDDEDETVRGPAFEALQRSGQLDALVGALQSRHDDVRILAAARLAEAGRSEAYSSLLAEVESERPTVKDLARRWQDRVVFAMEGLGWLRRAEAMEALSAHIDSSEATLREAASGAMARCAPSSGALAPFLEHADPAVRTKVGLGMAWRGDPAAAGVVFAKKARNGETIGAALGLADDEQLLSLLDHREERIRERALRAVLLLEWASDAYPERLLAALTVAQAEVRVSVAEVLEVWHDEVALGAAVARRVNDQGGDNALTIDTEVLRRLASALVAAVGIDRADVVRLLGLWADGVGSVSGTQEARERAEYIEHQVALVWARSDGRLAATDDRPWPAARAFTPQEAAELVFGTYVGLGSQAGDSRVRAVAVGRLAGLTGVPAEAVVDALLPALGDPDTVVRMAAFRALDGLVPTSQLVAEALGTGSTDLGQQALTRLADAGDTGTLWQVLASREDGLQLVAFDILAERAGERDTAVAALTARAPDVRARAVSLLSSRYDQDPAARDALSSALQSRFADVRRAVALTLAMHRDVAAFDALRRMLDDDSWQKRAIRALQTLPDPRVADALIDRMVNDPRGTADVSALLGGVGRTRNPEVVPRMVRILKEREDLANDVLGAMLVISGYDQRLVFDVDEPDADVSWLEGQHPRHDAVLARLLQLHADRSRRADIRRIAAAMTWARGSEVDVPLARMLHHADDRIRQMATTSLGWRLRYRHADSAPLQQVLAHKDPVTAFLAAEGLARAGSHAGLSVLLAAVDTLDQLPMRHRAVLALGHLADERALDKLLDIVNDDGHALIESAAEAIGHLRDTPRRDQILRRLIQLSRGTGNVALRALVGLRWFGTPHAWARVRSVALEQDLRRRMAAVELLRFDASPTRSDSVSVLERIIVRERRPGVASPAIVSLRRLLGPDSMEADYTYLRGAIRPSKEDTVQRLRERGDARRILEVLSGPIGPWVPVDALLMVLAGRDPLPIDAALERLQDPRPRAGALAARLLGRARGMDHAAASQLRGAAERALEDWERRRERDEALGEATERLRWLLWATARQGVGSDLVVAALALSGPQVEPVHAAAAEALSLLEGATDQLLAVARAGDARARGVAAGTLAQQDSARAGQALAELLDDRVVAEPLLRAGVRPADFGPVAADVHRQGIVLPHVVRAGDVAALRGALGSPVEDVRRGAVEALGVLAAPASEQALVEFATNEAHEEEERMAAWRALRRSKRRRARAGVAR